MVKGDLVCALDWKKKSGEGSGQYSRRVGGKWLVVQYGPGFSNTFEVTDYDDVGLRWLLAHESKEVTGAKD